MTLVLHATTVAVGGRGIVILGPSGSGKSGLALELMAQGAALVADDRTVVQAAGANPAPVLVASCPPALSGLIEARGVGILRSDPHPPCPVALVVDLGQVETARLPEPRTIVLLDVTLPLLHKSDTPHFAAAIRAYILGGRHDDRS